MSQTASPAGQSAKGPPAQGTHLDFAATAVQAIVLYSLLEFQSGNAKCITVTQQGGEFSVSDDGRGHPLDKSLEGVPYLRFIYTHFDYPFETAHGAPIQLQGIGMSLVTALCSELSLTVRKQNETLTACFTYGQAGGTSRSPASSQGTGITIRGRLRSELCAAEPDSQHLQAWLQGLVQVHPTLRLFFNGRELTARREDDA